MNRHSIYSTILLATTACCGCDRDLQTAYGQRGGLETESVNGTAVLGKMFERAGHKVTSWRVLSPRLQKADCIVWFPDNFDPPSPKERQWLDTWLRAQPGRTLIYVGRDFDAAPLYWQLIQPQVPPEQTAEVTRRLNAAQAEFQRERRSSGPDDCGWFTLDGTYSPRGVTKLSGNPKWLSGVDPSKLEMELNGRMKRARGAKIVLGSPGKPWMIAPDMLVSREYCDQSQLIVVANGSFLLNLPLVNHEHRKLAARLIEEVGPAGQNVVFLESGRSGAPICDDDPEANMPTGLEILVTKPYSWISLGFLVLAALFCLRHWPIFGVPRPLEQESATDFGRHIRALAELLRRTKNRRYALTRLLHYRQTIERKK